MKINKNLSIKETIIVFTAISTVAVSAGFIGYNFGLGNFTFDQQNKQLTKTDLRVAYETIDTYYDGNIDRSKIISGGIDGMISGLGDPNSYYLTAEEYKKANAEESGKYYGLGIIYSYRENKLTIDDIYPNSPAALAGLPSRAEIL